MAFTTTFTNKRAGVSIATGIACQVDDISTFVKSASGIPYDSYMLYTLFGVPSLQQGDLLVDEDPTHIDKFGNQLQYRVSDNPEIFDDHIESMIVLHRQKTP